MSLSPFEYSSTTDNATSTAPYGNSSILYAPEGCVVRRTLTGKEDRGQSVLISEIVHVGVLLPVMVVISVPTNALNMAVFYKQGLKERINLCLFSLSLVDMLFIVSAFGSRARVIYGLLSGKDRDNYWPVYPFVQRLLEPSGFIAMSQVISAMVALEKCLCVSKPLLARDLVSIRMTAVVLFIAMVATVGGVTLLVNLYYVERCVFNPEKGSTKSTVMPSRFYYQHRRVMDLLLGLVYGLILPSLCITIAIVCTAVTVVKTRKVSRWRETVSSTSRGLAVREAAMTRMVVGTSVLFVVCVTPLLLFRSAVLVLSEVRAGGKQEDMYYALHYVYRLAAKVNSTFNFFVYYTFGSKFRETLQLLCARLRARKVGRSRGDEM